MIEESHRSSFLHTWVFLPVDVVGWQISDNQDSLDMDPQEHSFTRTIDEEAELEERADREREEGHQDQDEEEEDREHEVMTAGSECTRLELLVWSACTVFFVSSEYLIYVMWFGCMIPVR